MKDIKVVSLFSGAGGLDLGFKLAGFNVIWANEKDKTVWETYRNNHDAFLDTRSIIDIPSDDIPDCDGIIGGPPCQSWSSAGAMRGIDDPRGKLFYEFIRVLRDKNPNFFVIENVAGILSKKNKPVVDKFKKTFEDLGYNVTVRMLNASDYGVPQDRKRVFFVGLKRIDNDIFDNFTFSRPYSEKTPNLYDAIGDIHGLEMDVRAGNLFPDNHVYSNDSFSSRYMSRNRVRAWDEQSFTILASMRHIPIHPQAPKMKKVDKDKFIFDPSFDTRRMTVRECARIQTFPDAFKFYYSDIKNGYKMVGNAVPVKLAEMIAERMMIFIEDEEG